MSTVAAFEKLKGAWKEHHVAKKKASELRKTFQEELTARKTIGRQVLPEHLQQMMIWEERARQECHESIQLRGHINKCPVLNVEVMDFFTGITIIVKKQEEIVAAATK